MRPHAQEYFTAVHEGDPDEQTAPPEVPQLQWGQGAGGQAVTMCWATAQPPLPSGLDRHCQAPRPRTCHTSNQTTSGAQAAASTLGCL